MVLISMLEASLAARPGQGNFAQTDQFIREFTGFFIPGTVVIDILGIFYSKTTATAALVVVIGSAVRSAACLVFLVESRCSVRVSLVFQICTRIAVAIAQRASATGAGALDLIAMLLGTSAGFNFSTLVVTLILCAFYITWWKRSVLDRCLILV